MSNRLIYALRAATHTAALGVVLVLAQPVSADALKRGDLPMVDNVTLIGVEDGQLKYRTAAGDRSAPLSEINDLALDNVPAFATGLKAFKDGEMRSAQRSFESIWRDNRVDWIRHFAGFYLAQVYDKRNEPVSAGQIYARLASDNADLFFLSKPPTESLEEADADQKERITAEIMAVARDAKGERREILQAYLRMVAGEQATLPSDNNGGAAEQTDELKKNSAVLLPEPLWRLTRRSGDEAAKWTAITMLAEGKYQETVDTITPLLSAPGDLPEKLFILGRAQLALADAAEEKDSKKLYQDAGLTFMRIVVHFNQQGRPHKLVAPAQLEVAYIHKKIGREDIFKRMLFGGEEGGGVHLVIDDEDDYPQYRLRYYNIIGEQPPE